jgi:two-component system alkaline phosphatase synthesis response regulator PhoP
MIGQKVLLIDDDVAFLKVTSQIFREAGAQVITARDGMEGISKVFTHQPNLIILDIMMPGRDGFRVCQNIRLFSNTPLIMLSALDQENLMLQSLEVGADDFLSKPINPKILLARVKTVLRRSKQSNVFQAALNYDDGRLKIDVEKHRVLIKDKRIRLTPVEFRLLVYLVSNAGRVLSFEQILVNVWGNESKENKDYVHVYISHLRGKIEKDTKKPQYILSVHGVGYIFEKPVLLQPPLEKAFSSIATS